MSRKVFPKVSVDSWINYLKNTSIMYNEKCLSTKLIKQFDWSMVSSNESMNHGCVRPKLDRGKILKQAYSQSKNRQRLFRTKLFYGHCSRDPSNNSYIWNLLCASSKKLNMRRFSTCWTGKIFIQSESYHLSSIGLILRGICRNSYNLISFP